MAVHKWVFLLCLIPSIASAKDSAPASVATGNEFAAADTLSCGDEPSDDAKECLSKLSWTPAKFQVDLTTAEPGYGDFLVRFPSPRPMGNATNDRVAMEWFAARDDKNEIRRAPAIVVVHESGSRMTIGRMLARGLSGQGLHAFMLHLPGYGARRAPGVAQFDKNLSLAQAIADVRRARDAVVSLPVVDSKVVGVQGTSLGGFVTATMAGLDHGYDRVFIFLAGGNLEEVVMHGAKDAAKVHQKLTAAGISDDQIKELARQVEPLRLAHRMNPAETWMFNGKYDDVVPPACSLALAKAAHLPDDHRVEYSADHYSGIVYIVPVVEQIRKHMLEPSTAPDGR